MNQPTVPEERAGEPDVVAIADGSFNCDAPIGSELITLQAHSDAMEEAGKEYKRVSAECGAMKIAIAKKDAALRACVDARKKLNNALARFRTADTKEAVQIETLSIATAEKELDAAIAQAEKELK